VLDFDTSKTWKLKYPDGTDVVTFPSSAEPFKLFHYREDMMRNYTVYIVLYVSQGKVLMYALIT